ncbi:MAG: MFS transporter [Firmicutes bacterium]|nr:MFS transporter [Bacillota bacterium]
MYMLLLAIIYLTFVSLGLPDSLLGAGWPVIHTDLGVSVPSMGIISMTISGGTICASLFSERITKKLGTRTVTCISVFLSAASMLGFSSATKIWMLIIWAVPYGLSAGAIDAALNNFVALHFSSRHMSWLHSFWGVGAIVSPYIMSHALSHSGWRSGYVVTGLLQAAIGIILVVTLPVWKVCGNKNSDQKGEKALGIAGTLRIKGVPFILAAFFSYCAGESTVMLWASSYLVSTGMKEEHAAAFASLVYIGITAGRFVCGFVSDRLGDRKMIRIGMIIAVSGAAVALIPFSPVILKLAGLLIIGFGCSPVYPSIIHSTPMNFGAENSQAVIGVQLTSAYIGSTFMPPVFGLLSSLVGLWIMPLYAGLFFGLVILMTEKTYKYAGGEKSTDQSLVR